MAEDCACNHKNIHHRLERAIAFAEGKWSVFPLIADAKAPLTSTGFKAATQDLEIIRKWWTATPNANIGIATGAASGIVVIDIDVKNGVNGQESIKAWRELPLTLTSSTPTGGYHLYFLYPASGLRSRTGILPGVDVKADRGYVVGPGSSIGNKPYEWIDPEVSIAALPESIIFQINEQRPAPAPSPTTKILSVPPGHRNATLARLAGSLRRKGTDPTEIESVLLAENFRNCTPPLPEDEVRTIARSISRYTPAARPPQAERFKPNVIAEELRQTHNFITSPIDEVGVGVRLWLYKDGVFTPDGETVARRMVHSTLGEESKPERISSVVELLKESTKTDSKHLNPRAADLINVENGMLNWRTGELLPHSPDYLSTVQIQASHTKGATSDTVDQFLREVFPPDALPLAEELLGYLLIPTTKHQKAFMLVGEGANGKSTFLSMLINFLGSQNVSNVSLQDLVGNRFAAAEIQWKLANIYADLPSASLEQSDVFKAIVAGDTIKVERKFGHPFKLQPTARLIFSANDLPRSRDLSHAYFRRWAVIPFPNSFEGSKAKRGLIAELCTAEARTALLTHAVAGLRRLEEQQAFTKCKSVEEAGQAYRTQCDSAYEFITGNIELSQDSILGKNTAYEKYTTWCSSAGIPYPVSHRSFNKRLQEVLKAIEKRDVLGRRVWVGLRLRDERLNEAGYMPSSPGSRDSKDKL